MKKIFILLLSFVFIITSSGVLVNMHYCMGKLAGTSLNLVSKTSSKCGKCGMGKTSNKGKGCCHDSKKLVKNIVDQSIVNHIFNIDHPIVYISTIHENEFISFPITNGKVIYNYSHAPPYFHTVPIYISDCSFLI